MSTRSAEQPHDYSPPSRRAVDARHFLGAASSLRREVSDTYEFAVVGVRDPGEAPSRMTNGLRARAETVPNRHKHGFRRSVAGSVYGHERTPDAADVRSLGVRLRSSPVGTDRRVEN